MHALPRDQDFISHSYIQQPSLPTASTDKGVSSTHKRQSEESSAKQPLCAQPKLKNLNAKENHYIASPSNSSKAKSQSLSRGTPHKPLINLFDLCKLRQDFKLVGDDERGNLIEDLLEFDKCFYLN